MVICFKPSRGYTVLHSYQ